MIPIGRWVYGLLNYSLFPLLKYEKERKWHENEIYCDLASSLWKLNQLHVLLIQAMTRAGHAPSTPHQPGRRSKTSSTRTRPAAQPQRRKAAGRVPPPPSDRGTPARTGLQPRLPPPAPASRALRGVPWRRRGWGPGWAIARQTSSKPLTLILCFYDALNTLKQSEPFSHDVPFRETDWFGGQEHTR